MADTEEEWEDLEPSLMNVIEQESLKWIFVGGKGGVGKTTTSCSLAVQLAKHRKSVLIISTDPAHNISDAFGQQFSKHETLVRGFDNLYAMEIDPTVEVAEHELLDETSRSMLTELASSIPGIDEAMSFAELMRQVQKMHYDAIVFDTAPTGHTLRLLSIPSVLESGLAKFIAIKDRFAGFFNTMKATMQSHMGSVPSEEQMLSRLDQMKATIEYVNRIFKDPDQTTFVCVCIPEFLSLFETERLVQQLAKYEIDSHNIVINHVLFPDPKSPCPKCTARAKMQKKYIDQIYELYEDFNITRMPQLDEEVRGVDSLQKFSVNLLNPYHPPSESQQES